MCPLHGEKIEHDKQTTRIIYMSHETSFDTISARTVVQQERRRVRSESECSDRNNRVLQSARRFALSRALFLVTTSWTPLDIIYSSAVSMFCAICGHRSVTAHRSQSNFHVLRRFHPLSVAKFLSVIDGPGVRIYRGKLPRIFCGWLNNCFRLVL